MILDQIIERTKEDLALRKSQTPFEKLQELAAKNPREIKDAVKALKSSADEPYRIVAEVKKASPSKGLIRQNFAPVEIAKEYEKGGANAISVLTEPHFFKGDLEYLAAIRRESSLPLLRKDFIIDEYQILEALVYGADFILLIAKALSAGELKRLLDYARSLGLEALVETHDEEDVEKSNFACAKIVGVNHRNLSTFEMDMSLCGKLFSKIKNASVIVAESGIYEHSQLKELHAQGADAFLIGEHFMRQEDLAKAVKTVKEG